MSLVYIRVVTDVTLFHGLLTDLKFLLSPPHEIKINPFYMAYNITSNLSFHTTTGILHKIMFLS